MSAGASVEEVRHHVASQGGSYEKYAIQVQDDALDGDTLLSLSKDDFVDILDEAEMKKSHKARLLKDFMSHGESTGFEAQVNSDVIGRSEREEDEISEGTT